MSEVDDIGGPPVAPDENGCYGWPRACEHDDDLGCMEADDMRDEGSARAFTLAEQVQHEDPAPPGERCDDLLHVGPTGVWRCQRQRGHDGACFARGVVDVPAVSS